ncbi:MAG: hypothetical protein ACREQ7_13835 [Candidatus Binatia bacterium]
MEVSLDQRINEVLDLLAEAARKPSEMSEGIEVQGWEEICEAKELLEKIPFGRHIVPLPCHVNQKLSRFDPIDPPTAACQRLLRYSTLVRHHFH